VSSKVVQNVTTDISKTKTVLNKTKKYLKHHCSQEVLEGTIKEVAITPEGLDFEPISALTQSTHPHNFFYEGHVILFVIQKKGLKLNVSIVFWMLL
jgi:GH35 family endo-1,4-beta-xylanase